MTVDEMQHRMDEFDRRMAGMETELVNLKTSVYGDNSRHIQGLLEQFAALRAEIGNLRTDLSELLTWRREVTLMLRVGLGFLGTGGIAQVAALIKAWGG